LTNLISIKAEAKTGNEILSFNGCEVGYSLSDFWKWSVSNLISNATRGKLAEFIVGSAVGINPTDLRDEWDAYDLKTIEGIKIEVKSASYIQTWKQKDYSPIIFTIKPAKFWDSENNFTETEPKRHADVYVFCLLANKDQMTIDPLKLEQWEFFVLPTNALNNYTRSQSSITLKSLSNLTSSIKYCKLKDEIFNCFSIVKNETPHNTHQQ